MAITTPNKLAANRANARESTGPQTPKGRKRSSRNALKHGLFSLAALVPGEDAAELERFREGMVRRLMPRDELERMLADRVMSQAWRLRRAVAWEGHIAAQQHHEHDMEDWDYVEVFDKPPDLPPLGEGERVLELIKKGILTKLSGYEQRIERSMYRALTELRRLQHEPPAPPLDCGGQLQDDGTWRTGPRPEPWGDDQGEEEGEGQPVELRGNSESESRNPKQIRDPRPETANEDQCPDAEGCETNPNADYSENGGRGGLEEEEYEDEYQNDRAGVCETNPGAEFSENGRRGGLEEDAPQARDEEEYEDEYENDRAGVCETNPDADCWEFEVMSVWAFAG